jgi:hypothetical protein
LLFYVKKYLCEEQRKNHHPVVRGVAARCGGYVTAIRAERKRVTSKILLPV